MTSREWNRAIDDALADMFQWAAWVLRQIISALGWVWSLLPYDWHPFVKIAVVFLLIVGGLRLVRVGLSWPLRWASLSFMKRHSPFGRAGWARLGQLRRAGMLKGTGLFLGQWRSWTRRADLYRPGEGHLLTVAGSGAGKTTGLVIPALLELRDSSVIVTDPKAQLAAMTGRSRASVGPVIYINPFADDLAASTGQALPDSGFNPLSILKPGPNLITDARNVARLLMVTDRADEGSYWNKEAGAIMALLLVWMALREPPQHRTLGFLWALVREDPAEIDERLNWFVQADDSPYMQGEGKRLKGLVQAVNQFQGVIAKAQDATAIYAPGTPLGEHTAKDGLDLDRLKHENLTVYLMIPTGQARVSGPWLNLLVGIFGLAIGKPGPARPVYLLMDEAPALGYLPDLRNHLRETREAGLRVWIFTQTRSALADPSLYGDNGFDDIMGLCVTKTFFSISEPRLAREISEILGEQTSTNRSVGDAGRRDRENINLVGVPLMRPEEILRMRRGRMLIVHGDLRPIRARLVPYWKRSDWQSLTDRNPYRS